MGCGSSLDSVPPKTISRPRPPNPYPAQQSSQHNATARNFPQQPGSMPHNRGPGDPPPAYTATINPGYHQHHMPGPYPPQQYPPYQGGGPPPGGPGYGPPPPQQHHYPSVVTGRPHQQQQHHSHHSHHRETVVHHHHGGHHHYDHHGHAILGGMAMGAMMGGMMHHGSWSSLSSFGSCGSGFSF